MGNKTGNITSVDFNPKEWQASEQQPPQNENKGNYKVLQNVKTGQLIDQYQMFWPSEEDFRFYLDSYYWRRQQYNIVPSRFIVEQHSDQFCSRSYGAKVYIEHVPTRLSDVTDIPFPDNLYVALAVLEGYQKLYENVHHYFPISEDQICVDREGVVKVWVNSDLSKNYPEPEESATDNKDEAHMVDELLNIVWENTDEESEPQSFREFFAKKKGKKRIGFDEAKVIVNEYAKMVSCQIPQKFNSILQMIEESDFQDDGHEGHQEDDMADYQEGQANDMDQNDHELHNMEGHHQNYQNYDQNQLSQQQHRYMVDQEGNRYSYQNDYENQNDEMYHQHQQQLQQGNDIYYQQQQHPSYPLHQGPHQVYYQHGPTPQQYLTSGPIVPHAVNPMFVPRSHSPQVGPVISIPPIRSNVTHHVNAPVSQAFSTGNVVYYGQNHPAATLQGYHHQGFVQHGHQPHIVQPYNGQFPQASFQPLSQSDHPLRIESFSNPNQALQQQISTLNPLSGQSSSHHQQAQESSQVSPSPLTRQELNSTVGRSLQLINESSKRVSQTQKQRQRINKSHITESGQAVEISYPGQQQQHQQHYYEQQYDGSNVITNGNNTRNVNSSRASGAGNSSRGEQGNNRGSGYYGNNGNGNSGNNGEELHFIREELMDTKYYTLDTEMELDEEIAADLKKMIMAL